jgi:DNA-binding transcriptional LysR family regulator
MDTLLSLRVFRQVVESGSFVGAAERLDLSTGMVSRHVMHVERRVGVRLLNRNSRTLSLTEPGKAYFERCRVLLDGLETTELELGSQSTAPRGTLRVTAPSWAGGQRTADLLGEFHRHCPEVVVDISFEDRLVDLVEEGYDLALRVARDPTSLPPGLISRPYRAAPFYIAASRDYLKRNGTPASLEELTQHNFVAAGNLSSLSFTGPKGPIEIPVKVVLRYRSVAGLASAVAAGIGLAPIPVFIFEDPVFKDTLVPVLRDYPLGHAIVYFVYVSHRQVPPKIRSFIDFLVESDRSRSEATASMKAGSIGTKSSTKSREFKL